MALIDKDKLKAEIERRCVCESTEINRKRLNRVIIEPSKRWQPVEGLEEAARHSEILTYQMPEDGDIEKVMKVQEARIFHEIGFKAGAEWQYQKDRGEFAKIEAKTWCEGFNEGFDACKKKMSEKAMEGYVTLTLTGVLTVAATIKEEDNIGFEDKVRVIVIKEDEK